jgi:restriction endonuclease S subunit
MDVDVIRVTEMKPHGALDTSTAVQRSVTVKQYQSRALQIGDLVLEKSGGGPNSPVGRVGFVTSVDKPTVCSNFMQLMRPAAGRVLPRYLHLYLTYFHSNGGTVALQTATTNIRNIKTPDYMATPIPLPPLQEQEKIVEILEEQLSRLDAAATAIKAVRTKAARFRRALLRTAFLAAKCRGGTDGSELPDGWTLESMEKLGRWMGGGTPSKSDSSYWKSEIPWLTPKDMKSFYPVSTLDSISIRATQETSAKRVEGPFVAIVVRSGILERTLPVAVVRFDSAVNQDMKVLQTSDGVLPEWVGYAVQAFERELLDSCRKAGTTVASIEVPRLLKFEIPRPPLLEQVNILESLKEQLARVDAALNTALKIEMRLESMRRSILHAAFSGNLTREWREAQNG